MENYSIEPYMVLRLTIDGGILNYRHAGFSKLGSQLFVPDSRIDFVAARAFHK